MNFFNSLFSRFTHWLEYGILGLIIGGAIWVWARRSWTWLLILLILAMTVCCFWLLPREFPSTEILGEALPPLFRRYFYACIWALGIGAIFLMAYLIRMLLKLRPATTAEAAPSELAERFPDLEDAWEEIQLRLGQAQINLADQHVYLILAPDEDRVGSLVRSSGVPVFAEAPSVPAPIHAYATAEGVYLSCAGASALGSAAGFTPDPEAAADPAFADGSAATARLEFLGKLLLEQEPDCPIVRGVAVAFPIDWAERPEALKAAGAVRDDLRTIQRVLQVRPPVFALVTGMEGMAGFPEFVARMPVASRQNRCGVAIPGSHEFSGDMINRALIWMAGWFHAWIMNLIAEDLQDQEGNNALIALDLEFRRQRKRLRNLMEAAFSTHRGTEPVLFRGCYFVGTGDLPGEQAFSGGLIRGARGRIPADHRATEWTLDAEREDRHYRRLALYVGLVGGAIVLMAWAYILSLTPLGWVGLGALALAWVVAIVRVSRW